MTVSTSVLRDLHRIHSQLSDLRDRLARGPRRLQAHEANVAKQEKARSAAQENVKQTKMMTDQKQLDLKSGENKILDLKAKLNGCSSNKEYQTLLDQIAASEMANSVLADEILEAMEKADQLEVAVAEEQDRLAAVEKQRDKCRETIAQEEQSIQGDITRLEDELANAEKDLPGDFKANYDRVIRSKGADGMAKVQDQVCLGCGKQITLNMQNELLLSKPVFCKSCGCLLYIGES
ncbi:MAG: phospholipase [Pirellulales bacterium]|nr:phospholipase [Pirellulales bacterium]